MKKIIVMLGLLVSALFTIAQSKQVKMYLEQIRANTVYMQYLKKAISITRTGLTTFGDIRNGEFNLHDLFFKGMSSVNPRIQSLSKVGDIISYQVNIVKSYKNSYYRVKASGQFTPTEINYIFKVFSNLLEDCTNIILMLADVLGEDFYQMTDDERIHRIDMLFASMQSNYRFCQKFCNNNTELAMQRRKEKNETENSKALFDIH